MNILIVEEIKEINIFGMTLFSIFPIEKMAVILKI